MGEMQQSFPARLGTHEHTRTQDPESQTAAFRAPPAGHIVTV